MFAYLFDQTPQKSIRLSHMILIILISAETLQPVKTMIIIILILAETLQPVKTMILIILISAETHQPVKTMKIQRKHIAKHP